MTDLEQAFACIPQLAGSSQAEYTITVLPGYTNRNYRLRNRDRDWVLRCPRVETNRFIDRVAEAHNQALAVGLGIAPEAAWRDDSGMTLTATLTRSHSPVTADFTRAKSLATLLAALQKLHRSGLPFRGRVDLNELLPRYFAQLDEVQQQRMQPRLRQAERILGRLEVIDTARVASHNDLVLENLLLDTDQPWLIDWEYSAMASPYWDLATLCNAARLDYRQSRFVLDTYCVDGSPMEESILFDYRGLLQLLSDCWMLLFARD